MFSTHFKTRKVCSADKPIPDPVEASNSSDPWGVLSLVLEERKNVECPGVGHEVRTSELEDIVHNLQISKYFTHFDY